MTAEPHPQRCNRTDCWAHKEGFCYAKCYTHTPAKSEQEIWNGVLDELLNYIDDNRNSAVYGTVTIIRSKIEELHKKGEQP